MRVTMTLSGLVSPEGRMKIAEIGETPFRVGRSPEADWTLEDPSSHVSGIHFELRRSGDDLLATDLSSGGTALDTPSALLQRGQPVRLTEGSVLHLPVGSVEILVERAAAPGAEPDDTAELYDVFGVRARTAAPSRGVARDAAAPPRLGGGGPSPQAGPSLGAGAQGGLAQPAPPEQRGPRSFDDLLADPAAPTENPFGAGPPPVGPSPAGPGAPRSLGGAPSDLTAPAASTAGAPADPGATASAGVAAGIADGTSPRASLVLGDSLDPPDTTPGPAPLVPPPGAGNATTMSPAAEGPADLGDAAAPRSAAAGAEHPPPVDPFDLAPTPARPDATGPHATTAGGADPALDALFRALGVAPEELTPARRAALAAEIGATYAAMADALRQLLINRGAVKRELGIARTEVQIGANPLKFSPTPQAAVDALLRPMSSGYLSGEAAVEDALRAMQSHQLALVGAIRAAIATALEAFDPAELERRIARRGLSQVVPALRRAELWERFCDDYARFAKQADEDIRTVVGRELDRLYASETGEAATPSDRERRG